MNKNILRLLILCLFLSGCSTLGAAGSGLMSGLTSLIKLPFQIAGTALNIAKMLPKPPPGVFGL